MSELNALINDAYATRSARSIGALVQKAMRLEEQFEVTQAALREAVLGFIGYAFPDDEPDDIVEEVISGFIQSGQLRLIAERGSNPAKSPEGEA